MTRQELIKALEAAEGPSRELDARIWVDGLPTDGDGFDGYGLAEGYTFEYWPEEDGSVQQYAAMGVASSRRGRRASPPFTASLDAATALVERILPGWLYSVCHCHVSDDAWLMPDFNDPAHSERLHREFGQVPGDPSQHWQDATDVALHPPRGLAIALCIALLRALEAQEAAHDDA